MTTTLRSEYEVRSAAQQIAREAIKVRRKHGIKRATDYIETCVGRIEVKLVDNRTWFQRLSDHLMGNFPAHKWPIHFRTRVFDEFWPMHEATKRFKDKFESYHGTQRLQFGSQGGGR